MDVRWFRVAGFALACLILFNFQSAQAESAEVFSRKSKICKRIFCTLTGIFLATSGIQDTPARGTVSRKEPIPLVAKAAEVAPVSISISISTPPMPKPNPRSDFESFEVAWFPRKEEDQIRSPFDEEDQTSGPRGSTYGRRKRK